MQRQKDSRLWWILGLAATALVGGAAIALSSTSTTTPTPSKPPPGPKPPPPEPPPPFPLPHPNPPPGPLPPPPNQADFSLLLSPTSVTVAQGSTVTFDVTAIALNGFAGTVMLGVTSVPDGILLAFDSIALTPGTPTKATLSAKSPGLVGNGTVTIAGTSGALTHTTNLSVTVTAAQPVSDWTLTVSQPTITAPAGSTTNFDVNVVPNGGANPTVVLSTPILPGGNTVSFTPDSATVAQPSFATLSAGNTPGSYVIEIDGTDGLHDKSATIALTIT